METAGHHRVLQRLRAATAGLSGALEDHFTAQLQALAAKDEAAESLDGMVDPIAVEILQASPELAVWTDFAIELEEVQGCGGQFDYPGSFFPEQWLAMRALYRARKRRESEEVRRDNLKREGGQLEQQHEAFLKGLQRVN